MKLKKISNFFKRNKKPSLEYQAFSATDLEKFKPNEYIIFTDKGVYAHGFNLKKLLKKFQKEFPNKKPLIVKVPPKKFTFM